MAVREEQFLLLLAFNVDGFLNNKYYCQKSSQAAKWATVGCTCRPAIREYTLVSFQLQAAKFDHYAVTGRFNCSDEWHMPVSGIQCVIIQAFETSW